MDYSYVLINGSLEIMSIAICLILISQQILSKDSRSKNKWFLGIVVFNMFMLFGDLAEWLCGGRGTLFSKVLLYVFSIYLYYAAAGLMMYSVLRWVLSIVAEKKEIFSGWYTISKVLLIIQIAVAGTMWLHKAAYVSEDGFYTRGSLFFIAMICSYALYFMSIVAVIRFRKNIYNRHFHIIVAFHTVPFIAQIIQVINQNFCVQNVLLSLVLIYVFAFVQARREIEHQEELRNATLQENERLTKLQNYQESFSDQLIKVLCNAIEAKDYYTRGHSLRVAQYAREIMYRMGGDEKAQEEIYYIGILHDIGKISISDAVINKNGKLTDEEYEQIKLHTVAGYHILRTIDVIPNLAIGARWHHERYDGRGYPNGLSGEEIPLIARIISVADAYDAMTSNRSYHNPLPQEYVRGEFEKGKGKQFDPKIAQIMLDMIDEDFNYEMKQYNREGYFNILIVDDDEVIHTIIKNTCAESNYLYSSAYNGAEGKELIAENEYDLCLLDLQMPDANGLEILEWIRTHSPKTKVFILTGDKYMDVILQSEKMGAYDYITKPINPAVLKKSMAGYLR